MNLVGEEEDKASHLQIADGEDGMEFFKAHKQFWSTDSDAAFGLIVCLQVIQYKVSEYFIGHSLRFCSQELLVDSVIPDHNIGALVAMERAAISWIISVLCK